MIIGGGVDNDRPPYRWFDKCDGHLTGSVAHLIDKILKQLDIDYKYTPSSIYEPKIIDRFNQMLLAGEVDARTTINGDDLAGILYTRAPISSVKLAVFYPLGRPAISGVSDLVSMNGAAISTTMKESKFSPVQNHLR